MATKTASIESPVRLISLSVSNFLRVRAVEIDIGGTVTTISGRNGQGKTSVLGAIAAALGGGKLIPERPIRKGAKSAEIILETDLYTVARSFTESGTTLRVVAKDGAPLRRPQEVLDQLLGDLSFDPLAFTRMKPADQIATLLDVAGLGATFAELKTKREGLELTRRDVGRERDRYAAALKTSVRMDVPEDAAPLAELVEELGAAEKTIAQNRNDRSVLQTARAGVDRLKVELVELESKIEQLRKRIKTGEQLIASNESTILARVDPDVESIKRRISASESVGEALRHNERLDQLEQQEKDASEEYARLTQEIELVDEEKESTLAAADLPVPGLSFTDAGLLLDGIPFEQASTSQQIRASVKMGLAQRPKLRLMLVRDGSLLDSDAMKELSTIAEEMDAQIIVERVGSSVEGVGVVIEDGSVVEESI